MKSSTYYSKKLALVTGGSSGIGLAIAQHLAADGASVFILARHKNMLEAAREQIKAFNHGTDDQIGILVCDVTRGDQVQSVLDDFVKSVGTPDILVNSAGVAHPGLVEDLDPKIFHWMMDVNYFGTVNVIKVLLPAMLARGSGHIINLSSMAGFLGVYGYTAYGASKYAVRGFSDALRAEMKPRGIKVSVAFPPDTQTPQLEYESAIKPAVTKELTSTASIMTPAQVASSILKGASHGKYVITPGFETTLYYYVASMTANAVYPVMDWMISSAIKKHMV